MAVSSSDFREFFGSFPMAVSVVTAVDGAGIPRGFTCTAVSAVSADPPLLLVCVDKRSQTLDALHQTRAFTVNVLAEGGEEISQRFAGRSERKFDGLRWHPSTVTSGAPVLAEATLARAECTVTQTIEAGDHAIFIGLIERAEVSAHRPLLYQRGSYTVWDEPALAQAPQ